MALELDPLDPLYRPKVPPIFEAAPTGFGATPGATGQYTRPLTSAELSARAAAAQRFASPSGPVAFNRDIDVAGQRMAAGAGVKPARSVTKVPFYNRPIPVPAWLSRLGAVGTVASMVPTLAQGLKDISEWSAEKWATRNASDLTPNLNPPNLNPPDIGAQAPATGQLPPITDAAAGAPAAAPVFTGGATPRGSVNVMEAANFGALSPTQSAALSTARQDAANRGDFGAVAASYQTPAGGTWMGRTAEQDQARTVMADAIGAVRRARTVTQQKNAMEHLNTLIGNTVTANYRQQQLGLAATKEAREADIAYQNAFSAWVTAKTGGDKNMAETARINLQAAAARRAEAAGAPPAQVAAIAAGRAEPSSQFTEVTSALTKPGGPVTVLNRGTGQTMLSQPQATMPVRPGTDGKFYVVGPDGKAVREATVAERQQYQGAR